MKELSENLGLIDAWIRYDATTQRIEIPLSAAEEIAEHLNVPVLMIEVHPTHERLEVGSVYLNDVR